MAKKKNKKTASFETKISNDKRKEINLRNKIIELDFDRIPVVINKQTISILVEKKGWYLFHQLVQKNKRLEFELAPLKEYHNVLQCILQAEAEFKNKTYLQKKKRLKVLLQDIEETLLESRLIEPEHDEDDECD